MIWQCSHETKSVAGKAPLKYTLPQKCNQILQVLPFPNFFLQCILDVLISSARLEKCQTCRQQISLVTNSQFTSCVFPTLADSEISSQNGDRYSNSPARIKSNNSSWSGLQWKLYRIYLPISRDPKLETTDNGLKKNGKALGYKQDQSFTEKISTFEASLSRNICWLLNK